MLEPAEERLLQVALNALEKHAGIRHAIHDHPEPHGADALVTLEIPLGKDEKTQRATYKVVAKNADRPEAAKLIRTRIDATDNHYHTLLVAPKITGATAQACREIELQYVDAAGNAYLRGDHYLIFLAGMKAQNEDLEVGRGQAAGTPAALKIIFTILCNPGLLNAPYREIAQAAGVALGAIGGVLVDLERRQFVTGGTRGQRRRLIDPQRLVDEWVTNYPIRLRPKLHPRRFIAQNPDWRAQVDLREYGAWWGGEIAADRYTNYLRPATTTIYQRPRKEELTRLLVKARLRPDPKGDIELLDAFWTFPAQTEYPDVVPPLLAYADLLVTLDPRNIEVAKRLYRERIADAIAEAADAH